MTHVFRHAALDLDSDRLAKTASPQLRFDGTQEIVGLVFLQIEIGVARDAEKIRIAHVHAGEQDVEMMRD